MILVTGATGLVGGHLIRHLLQHNDKIVALRREKSNLTPLRAILRFYGENVDEMMSRIEWRFADMNDDASLKRAFEGIEYVYHCAAVVSLGKGDVDLLRTNIEGTARLTQICLDKQIKKLCFVSSIAACGKAEKHREIHEELPWVEDPDRSVYARSKYLAEQEVWKAIDKGLPAVIVNPGVILGFSGTSSGSAQIFTQMRKGLLFYTLGGSGYVDVKDVVLSMIGLMKSDVVGERYILVGENRSNKEILTLIAKGFKKQPPFINIGKGLLLFVGSLSETLAKLFRFTPLIDRSLARSASNRSYYSNKKISKQLNIKFTPIAETIAGVCDFMLKEQS